MGGAPSGVQETKGAELGSAVLGTPGAQDVLAPRTPAPTFCLNLPLALFLSCQRVGLEPP